MVIRLNSSRRRGEERQHERARGLQTPGAAGPLEEIEEKAASEVPDVSLAQDNDNSEPEAGVIETPASVIEMPEIVSEPAESVTETPPSATGPLAPTESPSPGALDNVTPGGYYRRKPTPAEVKKNEKYRRKRLTEGYRAMIDIFDRRDAWETNPEEEVRKHLIADKSGMPKYFMDDPAYMKEAETRAQIRDAYGQYEGLSDVTLNWMRAADNLLVARDDAVALDAVHKSYNRMVWSLSEGLDDFAWWKPVAGIVSGLLEGWALENRYVADMDEAGETRVMPTLGELGLLALLGGNFTQWNTLRKQFGPDAMRATARFQRNLSQAIDPGAYMMPSSTVGRLTHDIVRSSGYSLYAAGRSALVYAGASLVLPGAGFFLATWLGTASEARSQAARAYDEALQRGMPKDEALKIARNVTYGNLALLIGTEAVQNALTFGVGRLGRPLISGAVRGSRAAARAAWIGEKALSAAFEGFEEVGQDLIDAWALGDEVDPEALKWSFAVGVGSGGVYSAGGFAMHALGARTYRMMDQYAKIARAQKLREGIEDLAARISETKTASRIPEKMEDFVREATNGSIEKIYVDGKRLAEFAQIADQESIEAMQAELAAGDENMNAEMQQRIEEFSLQLAEELGITDVEAYFEALATGTDVEVDAAKLLTKIGTDESYASLKDHIKLSPTEMSAFEAQQMKAVQNETVRRLTEDMVSEQERTGRRNTTIEAIGKDLEHQIVALKRPDLFGKKGADARKDIQLVLSWLSNKAEAWGVEVEALAKPGDIKAVLEGDDAHFVIPNLQQRLNPAQESSTAENLEEAAQARQAEREEGFLGSFTDLENRVGMKAEIDLAADETAFADIIDNLDPSRVQQEVRMMATPLVFNLARADILPVYVNTGKLIKIQKDHPTITRDILKQIPRKLADPIAIFESKNKKGQFDGLVAMLELKDANTSTVVAALHLRKTEGRYIVNKVASTYAKDSAWSGLPRNKWFVDEVAAGRLRYVDTKKAAAWSDDAGLQLLPSGVTKQQLHSDSIKTESDLRKLKNAYPEVYQSAQTPAQENIDKFGEQNVQGRMRWTKDAAIVILHKTADKSTFLHEISHFFLEDLRESAHLENAPDVVKQRWKDFVEEFGLGDLDLSRPAFENKQWYNAQERFAVGFESYLMEGKAPTKGLERMFRAFKKWLLAVYKTIKGMRYLDADGNWQSAEINDNIRRIYDLMLVSDEAIENEAVMNDMAADDISMEALRLKADESVPQEAFDALDEVQREVVESAKERLLAEILGEESPEHRQQVARRADELKSFIRSIVEREPVYQAIAAMEADAALRISREEVLDGFGDTALAALPEGIDAEGGVPLDIAADAYGFAGAQEMIDVMIEALPLEIEVERRAVEQALRDQGSMLVNPEQVASKAQDALFEGDEALDRTLMEAEILRNHQDADLEQEAAQIEAERENPLNRRNVVKAIKEQGRLDFRKVKEGYGKMEARELAEATGGALWRKGILGLDEAVQILQATGIPVRDEAHLVEILKSPDTPLLSSLDRAYQQGFLDSRAANRRAREKASQNEQQRKEWLLLNQERLKNMREQLKQAAEGVIGAKESTKAVDPKPYIRAANRAKAEAERAMKKGDWTAAAAAKDRQAINEACARAAIRAGKEQDRILHFLRKFANRPGKQTFGVAPAYLAQIDELLKRFDLRKKPEEGQPVKSLAKFVEELQAKGEPVLIPEEILNANYRKSYKSMTMDEMRTLNDAVKNIERLGKFENKFIGHQRNVQVETVATMIARRMIEYFGLQGPSAMDPAAEEVRGVIEKMKKAPESFLASIEMVEFLTRAMDGYEDLGTAHQYIFQPVRDAVARETELLNETFAKLNDLVKEIYGTDKPGFKKEKIELNIRMRDTQGNIIPGRNWVLTKDQIIAAVLNMGNAGNMQRLVDGWGLLGSEVRELVDALSEQDLWFVQGIWDLFEGLRPMVQETAELMTGVTPQWVEPTPLVTKYGTLRGGYYPIVTDSRYSMRAAQQEELSNLMGTVNLDYLAASTRAGHRKERADSVSGRPPLLNLSVVDRHLIGVIHDAALAPAVRDVNKLIHHQAVRDAVKQALGEEQNKVLNHWLRAVANNNKNNGVVMDEADRGLGIAQRGVAAMGLGANISGALLQVAGYFPLAARIGPLRTVRAMLRGMASPKETVGFVLEKSAFMREQVKGQDRDVRKMAEKWTIEGKGRLDAFRSLTLSHYSVCQNLCNIPGWLECYKLGLKKFGENEAKAIKYADSVIRQTQGAGTIADLTRFETSGTWKKMFTMFYSWFRVMHNMNVETFRRVKNEKGFTHRLGVFMNHALFVLVMPRLIEELIRGDGPDDDETWAQYLLKESLVAGLMSPIEAIPVVRDVAGAAKNKIQHGSYFGGYRFTPLSATLESVTNLLSEAGLTGIDIWGGDEPDWTNLWKSFTEATGYVAGLPARQASKWWEVFDDSFNDEATFMEGAFRVILGRRKPKD